MGEGVSYNFVFTELPFKTVSGDVTAFQRIDMKVYIVYTMAIFPNIYIGPNTMTTHKKQVSMEICDLYICDSR